MDSIELHAAPVNSCLIGDLTRVRHGTPLAFEADSIRCGGAQRSLGFGQQAGADAGCFLPCDIPHELDEEHFKELPELVRRAVVRFPQFNAPGKYIVFKRWDQLESPEEPEAIIFFAKPDVLSGLFTLANFDEAEHNAVYTPFASGCASIVCLPYLERDAAHPRCILGMFDVSARPFVPKDTLSFAVPMKKFSRMVANMDRSFLKQGAWKKLRRRIGSEWWWNEEIFFPGSG